MIPCVKEAVPGRDGDANFFFGSVTFLPMHRAAAPLKNDFSAGVASAQARVQCHIAVVHVKPQSSVQSGPVRGAESVVTLQWLKLGKQEGCARAHHSCADAGDGWKQAHGLEDDPGVVHGVGRTLGVVPLPVESVVDHGHQPLACLGIEQRKQPQSGSKGPKD